MEILARMIANAERGHAIPLNKAIYEYPLDRWQDVHGSRLKSLDFLVAAIDLAAIYWRYTRRGATAGTSPSTTSHRTSSVQHAASRRGLTVNTTLYDELHRVEQTHWWFRARRHIVWSLVRRYIGGKPSRRLKICELGCGTGGNLAAVADKHDVVGVECSPQALEYARQTLGDRVRCGRLPDEIDLPPASFDVVLLTDVLEHIEDDAASARTALRLLRPGGIVVATVPAYQWLYSPRDAHHHHFRRYGKRQFAGLWTQRAQSIAAQPLQHAAVPAGGGRANGEQARCGTASRAISRLTCHRAGQSRCSPA